MPSATDTCDQPLFCMTTDSGSANNACVTCVDPSSGLARTGTKGSTHDALSIPHILPGPGLSG